MEVKLIDIGNSKGIRIPKAILQQVGLQDYVELEVQDSQLILRPKHNPRAGWEQAFRQDPPTSLSEEDAAWLDFADEDTLWSEGETW